MTVLFTCSQCGQTFDPDESSQACPKPISVAAAEHLANVEAERDEALHAVRVLVEFMETWWRYDSVRHTDEDRRMWEKVLAAFRQTDLLGEP